MQISEARYRANRKYEKANYYRTSVIVPNEVAEQMLELISEHEMSRNGFIIEAIKEKIERMK